jgi:hypothetical protein
VQTGPRNDFPAVVEPRSFGWSRTCCWGANGSGSFARGLGLCPANAGEPSPWTSSGTDLRTNPKPWPRSALTTFTRKMRLTDACWARLGLTRWFPASRLYSMPPNGKHRPEAHEGPCHHGWFAPTAASKCLLLLPGKSKQNRLRRMGLVHSRWARGRDFLLILSASSHSTAPNCPS